MNMREQWIDWLEANTIESIIKNATHKLTTPFRKADGSYIEIFLKKKGSLYTISDNGKTLADVEHMPPIKVRQLIHKYGCTLNQREIYAISSENNVFAQTADMISCLMQVSCFVEG